MESKLNNNINIDLHIHSIASKYKENKNIVKDSTKQNLDVLFQKLQEHNINLFSITDHNRFDDELFLECKKIISTGKYNSVKNILVGVEFDVNLDNIEKGRGHIIAIFNVEKNNQERDNLKKISKILNNPESEFHLNKETDFFTRDSFEKLLKVIGLDVILIANQVKDITNKKNDKKDKSLSKHSINLEQDIWFGFISAFELQTPKTQGIVKDSLRKLNIPSNFPLIFYTDCHDWKYYPWHDKSQVKEDEKKYFTSIKSLPTFKGILMAFTSSETRFNRINNVTSNYIQGFYIKNNFIELSSGINVVIGDNGTGKTALLNMLQNGKLIKEYKILQKENNISLLEADWKLSKNIKYIAQNEILDKRNSEKLLNDFDYFEDISTIEEFKNKVDHYAKQLWNFVNHQIKINDKINNLNSKKIILQIPEIGKNYFILIVQNIDTNMNENFHKEKLNKLEKIIQLITLELEDDYYDESDKILFTNLLSQLKSLYQRINIKNLKIISSQKVKNIVHSSVSNYKISIDKKMNDLDKRNQNYQDEKQKVINAIIEVIKLKNKKNINPIYFEKMDGFTKPEVKGYVFLSKANFHNIDTKLQFYEKIFNKSYASEDKILNINNLEEFAQAVSGANTENVEVKYNKSTEEFIKEQTKVNKFILEIKNNSKNIGNTPGEMALAYYKFSILDNQDLNNWDILIIDQPEDNISNKKINEELIKFLSLIRDKKQVILVTHNPLLVINLDVDNVLHMTKNDEGLKIKNGCLEYHGDEYNILSLIQNDMDGGYEAIKRRLKIYDSNN